MSNKTSDKNVANIEIIENFIFELKSFGLNKDTLEVANELENLLSDYTRQKQINEEHQRINGELREKVKELERNSNCDSVYAIKFATMQQQINEKDKRIKELEEENTLQRRQLNSAFDNGYIHTDKIRKLIASETINISGFECIALEDLQELLGGENK